MFICHYNKTRQIEAVNKLFQVKKENGIKQIKWFQIKFNSN